MCNCKPGLTETERFSQQILLELPAGDERLRRIAAGLSIQICIDPCILEEIKVLWDSGIKTRGCCCGHNNPDLYPFVNVSDDSIEKMLQMGYEQRHPDPERRDTFLLKSA